MLKKLLATVAFVAALASASQALADPPGEHPSFLQAVVFFLSGHEPPNYVRFFTDEKGGKRARSWYVREGQYSSYEYVVDPVYPCTVYQIPIWSDDSFLYKTPPATAINFLRMPSPRAAYVAVDPAAYRQKLDNEQKVNFDLPKGAMMHPKANETEPLKIWSINMDHLSFGGTKMLRRLDALDYIRKNFCMGLPEPPPRPVPAY
jgi:hypothetical protein